MAEPSYFVGIELETGSFTNITEDVLRFSVSRQLSSPTRPLSPGEAQVLLSNPDGRYSPDNKHATYPKSTDTTVTDRTSSGNNGVVSGTAIVDGLIQPGYARSFDGVDDVIAVNSTTLIDGYTDFTVELTINPSSSGNFADVFLRNPNGGTRALEIYHRYNPPGTNKEMSIFLNGGLGFLSGDDTVEFNKSTHVAITRNGSSLQWIIDGVTTNTTSFAATLNSPGAGVPIRIGDHTGSTDPFAGSIDEVRLWNVSRTPGQIRDNMHKHLNGDEAGLVGYWDFNGDHELRPNLPVQITADYNSSTHNIFRGVIDEWSTDPDLNNRRTQLNCRDGVKRSLDKTITTSLFTDYNIGSMFVNVLSEANVNSFSVDVLQDEQPFIWYRDRQIAGVMDELMGEGFFFSFVDGAGTLNVKKRYYDITQSVVASVQAFRNFNYRLNDDQVFNDILVEGTPREQDTSVRSIGNISEPIEIPASDSVVFFLEYLDPDNNEPAPAVDLVTPVNSTDYQAFENADGSGTEQTATTSASVVFFGQTAKNTVFNGTGSAVWLTRYGIRGKPIHRRPRITAQEEDTSSQNVYGERTFNFSNPLLGKQSHNDNYALFLVDRFKNPLPEIDFTIVNSFDQILSRELGDKIVLTNTFTGAASLYVVNALTHHVELERGLEHELELAVDRFRDSEVLILDDANLGKLDNRKLGF